MSHSASIWVSSVGRTEVKVDALDQEGLDWISETIGVPEAFKGGISSVTMDSHLLDDILFNNANGEREIRIEWVQNPISVASTR